MSKSAASRRYATRTTEPSRVPAWVWLFTGAVLGAFIMFLMHLSDVKPSTDGDAGRQSNTEKVPPKTTTQKPRFDFYDLLKENEVPPPAVTPAQQQQKRNATPPQEFLLQVASFKTADDAERLRAELILLNLDAYTENAKIRNGETWHRVMVGPFSSTSKMSKARSILLSQRHEALVLKRKPQP